jgi:3-hydroxyacyl-CoA dehydrogenase / enoyl-CoA hydratase / 3-hydroxybutyryl-CoA epimerase
MPATLRTSTDSDRVMTITLDLPDRPVNILSSPVLRELDELIARIELEKPRAVMFTSIKPRSFVAGADLSEMRAMTRPQLDAYLALGQTIFGRIAQLAIPTVAAINGDALGGGLELALACGCRVAADDRAIQLGLTEVKLGLVPGFGGTVRLPRLIGLAPALAMMGAGQTIPPREAMRLGLVDEIAPREALLGTARRLVLARPRNQCNQRPERDPVSPQERNHLLDQAEYDAEQRSQGRYPAAARLVDVIRSAYEHGIDRALVAERKALLDLLEGETGRNLVRNFFMRQSARKVAAAQVAANPSSVRRAAVIGGGTMGSGIAHGLIRAGIDVHLIEASDALASAASGRVRKVLADDVAAGRLDDVESQRAGALLHVQSDWRGIELADIVIEAVAEDMNIKRDVFARLNREARPDAVLASNTSSLSIAALAECTTRRESVIGMHFFNPVPKMPLLEIVRTKQSSGPALATVVALGARLGKAPILVNDAPGFVVNGLLIPYLSEALRVIAEGAPLDAIDRAIVNWGMPMGPVTLIDHIGLDVCVGIFKVMAPSRGARVILPRAMEQAIQNGWLGRKAGRGLYVYDPTQKHAPPPVNHELVGLLLQHPATPPAEEQLEWRPMLMMANEAVRVLEDHVTDSAEAIDLAVLLGLGMGQFRGGILRWVDSVGADKIVARLNELAKTLGPRFAPSPLLVELAKSKRLVSEYKR